MYKHHSEFVELDNKELKIWRFLDFTKFVTYLDKKALFFVRADNLDDRFEGKFINANIEHWKNILKIGKNMERLEIYNAFRKTIYICSWHMNEYESAAMWKLYLKSDEGVAIQSTFKRLMDCFKNNNDDDIYIGKVRYIDYNKENIKEGNIFNPFLYKRKSFEHERELRAVTMKSDYKEQTIENPILHIDPGWIGNYVKVDLNVLIEKIIVSPTAPEWFAGLVGSIMKKYGFNKKIVQSNLSKDPIY
jgi:hypothetical protein